MRILRKIVFWIIALFVSMQLWQYHSDIAESIGLYSDDHLILFEKILATITWCIVFMLTNLLFNIFIWNKLVSNRIGTKVPSLLKIISAFVIGAIIISIIITSVYEKSITAFLAFSGAIGLVLGIALQHSIVDFFSGIIIHLERPFKIGDFIMLNNTRLADEPMIGRVSSIDWRTSRLIKTDGNTIIVPNNRFTQLVLTNFSLPEERSRMEIEYCIGYEFETERVCNIILTALFSVDGIQDYKPPKVKVSETTLNGAIYQVRYWVLPPELSPGRSRDRVNRAVIKYLSYAGISLTHKKTDIYHAPMDNGLHHEDDLKRALLNNIPIFKSLSAEHLDFLYKEIIVRNYHEGVDIVTQSDPGNSMYIMAEGFATVQVKDETKNEMMIVGKIGPGQYFGEMSLVKEAPRSATVKTEKKCTLYEINKNSLNKIIEQDPNLLNDLMDKIESRKQKTKSILMKADQTEEEVMQKSIRDKIDDFFN